MAKGKVAGVIVGLIVGGLIGVVLGVSSGYALAEFVGVDHRETQAYFMLFLSAPICALVGAGTGVATGLALTAERKLLPAVPAALGGAALLFVLGLGILWRMPAEPAEFRVRNETGDVLEETRLGRDYRRARRVGRVGAGETSGYVEVDLDARGTFNSVSGKRKGRHFQAGLELEEQTGLEPGRYTYVVRLSEDGKKVELELLADD